MTVTDWSHHVTRVDASRSDEGCKMLLLLCLHTSARTHSSNQCPHVCVLCAHIRVLVQRAAAAASCSLHHCAMRLCVSRDVTNGLPSYTAIHFDFKSTERAVCIDCRCRMGDWVANGYVLGDWRGGERSVVAVCASAYAAVRSSGD